MLKPEGLQESRFREKYLAICFLSVKRRTQIKPFTGERAEVVVTAVPVTAAKRAVRFSTNTPATETVTSSLAGTSYTYELITLPLYLVGQMERLLTDQPRP
jgi:hypothetical protein